jgi:hypothetical protein
MKFGSFICLPVLLAGFSVNVSAKESVPMAFVEMHCFDCHDADVAKGGLNFEAL